MPSSIKLVLTVIMLLVSVMVQSAEETNEYYENGALQFSYSYRNGSLHGITKEYYETSELKAELDYRSGKLIAKREFRRNGDLKYELKYEGGNKIETELTYYPTGELFRQRTFVNGRIEGLEIDYYRTGQKKAERNYVNGKRDGSAKGFHINGNVQGDWIFESGEPVFATLFYSSGEKWLIYSHFDEKGRLDGASKEYDKKGNLMAIRYYVKNEMVKRRRISPWLQWWWNLWY